MLFHEITIELRVTFHVIDEILVRIAFAVLLATLTTADHVLTRLFLEFGLCSVNDEICRYRTCLRVLIGILVKEVVV